MRLPQFTLKNYFFFHTRQVGWVGFGKYGKFHTFFLNPSPIQSGRDLFVSQTLHSHNEHTTLLHLNLFKLFPFRKISLILNPINTFKPQMIDLWNI